MILELKKLFDAKDLIVAWTGRTIRGRYQQSVFGVLWAVLQPAATVAIFTFIFTKIVPVDTGDIPYPVFSLAALIPWTFFSSSLIDMTISLTQNMGLVMKIYFPREAIPLAAMLARLSDFAVSLCLLFVLMLVFQVQISPYHLLYLPLVLLTQIALQVGLGLFTSALNVFYRDVHPFLMLVVQLWFYASPIIYPVTFVPENLRPYYYLNPMVGVLDAYRNILILGTAPDNSLLYSLLISMILLVGGYWFFKRVEYVFADIV